jgi:hypothetical protein
MRRTILLGLALLATGAGSAPAMPGWLAGCWSEQKGSNWTEECWMGPRGGNMLGSGRNGRGDDVRSWEAMQIVRGADGKLVFYGSPKGAARVAFPELSSGPREIVFANPQHDYPQRIHYWREGMDLAAETSLMDGTKAFRWRYVRQPGS